jgi:hypothetical protein
MVELLSSHDTLKPTKVFGISSGARADILRAMVVFLHATFEVALRSLIPKLRGRWNFYSSNDLDRALRFCGIDATPFRCVYPTLTQLAKRRQRIVHNADFLRGQPHEWSIADDWSLIMWLIAVPAFYYQLRISLRAATEVERAMPGNLRTAMARHVAFGKQMLALPAVPRKLRLEALQEIVVTLKSISSTLQLDPRALIS